MTKNPMRRLRAWWRRVRAMPARLERLENEVHATFTNSEIVRDLAIERLGALRAELAGDVQEIAALTHRQLREALDVLDGAIAEQGSVLRTALDAPVRDATARALADDDGPSGPLHPGLSILTITWNHADRLPDAMESGLAVLDRLPGDEAGELLVLDNGSTDHTDEVLAAFTARDHRVRATRAATNLGLSRARNVLLHACDRTHALVLDADNRADPDGVRALYDIARRHDCALTYGALAWRHETGEHVRIGSDGPVSLRTLERLDVDTFAVVDVAMIRRVHGWTLDPALDAFDDQELVRRISYLGRLIGFVPVIAGTYNVTTTGHSRARGDLRPRRERIERLYRMSPPREPVALVAHPKTGPLWASESAIERAPALQRRGGPVSREPAPRVLVVAPGGVGNLGDDMITIALVERVASLCPSHEIELVSDGAALPSDLPSVVWAGTLPEVVAGLRRAASRGGVGLRDDHGDWQPVDPAAYDLVILGGGGNLNSLWQHELVANRAALVAAARAEDVPVIATGQGVGPFTRDTERRVVQSVLRDVTAVGVRDELSRDELGGSTPGGVDSEVVGDDALGLASPPSNEVDVALAAIGVHRGASLIALHIRRADYVALDDDALAGWADALDALAAERGAYVVGVALNWEPPRPEPIALMRLARSRERRAPWRILDEHVRPRLVAGVLRRADRALVCSYHAALVCLEADVPTLYFAGTDYSRQKAEGLRRLAMLPEEMLIGNDTPGADVATRLAAVERALGAGGGLDAPARSVESWLEARVRAALAGRRHLRALPG